MLLQVVLVSVLGSPKRLERFERRYNGRLPTLRRVHNLDEVLSFFHFLLIAVKNGGPVGRALVVPLLVERRRVVDLKEEVEEVSI